LELRDDYGWIGPNVVCLQFVDAVLLCVIGRGPCCCSDEACHLLLHLKNSTRIEGHVAIQYEIWRLILLYQKSMAMETLRRSLGRQLEQVIYKENLMLEAFRV
ncbi:hypothetical protein L195_g052718, partial [Trifolium pratense]